MHNNILLSSFTLGDFRIDYLKNENNQVGMLLLPTGLKNTVFINKSEIDSLVHVKVMGDAYATGFASGSSLRCSSTTQSLQYLSQHTVKTQNKLEIITALAGDYGIVVEHHAVLQENLKAVVCFAVVKNKGEKDVTIEMITSFSLGNLTPYAEDEAVNQMILHTIQSTWAAEGKMLSQSVEQLNFETSWAAHGMRSIRFGQAGSLPVKGYFPFAALEDKINHVTWAAQIECASSWQMEYTRYGDGICMSGGLADREFGHWYKNLKTGEEFATPHAIVTAAMGDVEEACRNIYSYLNTTISSVDGEEDLPIVFNEFCTTWCNPNIENIKKIVDAIKGKGFQYFVIDGGWYKTESGNWEDDLGDWNASPKLFPNGLKEAADYIRKHGMIPGLWFEFENVGIHSALSKRKDWVLTRDDNIIKSGKRIFLDMENPEVLEYLNQKVVKQLKDNGFGYIKVDYNETIGIGCDGYESLGEGVRRKVLATQRFFKKMTEEIPHLIVENCASGGNRLEPSMLKVSSMTSFSDAHECPEIPVIAANVGRLIPAKQAQIWAVLRAGDSPQRLYYSLAATMLGRICISGDVPELSSEQWNIVAQAISFYNLAKPVIKTGDLYITRENVSSYRKLTGYQATVRMCCEKNQALVVVHNFTNEDTIKISLGADANPQICSCFGVEKDQIEIKQNVLHIKPPVHFWGCAILLNINM